MYNNNPYAQGGWYNPGNPLSINQTCSPSQPSIYGALPGLQNCAESCLTFALCPNNPDILNCSVVGPRGSTHFVITSDYHSAPVTYLRTPDGTLMGYIEWTSKKPFVCITDSLSKQPASQWLHLSADKRLRTMVAHDRPFVWVPKDNEIALNLTRAGGNNIQEQKSCQSPINLDGYFIRFGQSLHRRHGTAPMWQKH